MLNSELMRYIVILALLLTPSLCYTKEASGVNAQAIKYREEGYKLQAAGNLKEALVYYEKAAQMAPFYVEVYNDLGVVYDALGYDAKALAMFQRALEIDPGYLPTYANLGFFYERRGDMQRATYYWGQRYEKGVPGEYWREAAKDHLLRLGTYPKVREEMLEKEAVSLSKQLVYQNEQKRLQANEEARLHFEVGAGLLKKGNYAEAAKEFQTALSLDPSDKELKEKLVEYHNTAETVLAKEEALASTQEALSYLKQSDFLSAGDKLKAALSAVYRIVQKQ